VRHLAEAINDLFVALLYAALLSMWRRIRGDQPVPLGAWPTMRASTSGC
jgi:hypothetical protein